MRSVSFRLDPFMKHGYYRSINCMPRIYFPRENVRQTGTIQFYLKVLIDDIPPSIRKIWPVIQEPSSLSRWIASWAISCELPIRFNGWRSADPWRFCSLDNKSFASGVSVNDGAMTFTRIRGANSAASDRANPSMAALALATDVWKGIPIFTATVLNIGDFIKLPIAAWANMHNVAVGSKAFYDLKANTGASPDNEYVFGVHIITSWKQKYYLDVVMLVISINEKNSRNPTPKSVAAF